MGVAALMNGGLLIPPTFLNRSEQDARAVAPQVIKPSTTDSLVLDFEMDPGKDVQFS